MSDLLTPTGRASKYLTEAPDFSLSKDPRTGSWVCKFNLADKKFSRSTHEANERKAHQIAITIRNEIWVAWKQSVSIRHLEQASAVIEKVPVRREEISQPDNSFDNAETIQRVAKIIGREISSNEIINFLENGIVIRD